VTAVLDSAAQKLYLPPADWIKEEWLSLVSSSSCFCFYFVDKIRLSLQPELDRLLENNFVDFQTWYLSERNVCVNSQAETETGEKMTGLLMTLSRQ
jgi:hypothetical protein